MGAFQRDSHDRKKSMAGRGQSAEADAGRPLRRFIYSQTNGWQQVRSSRTGGRNRLGAAGNRWMSRF